MIMEVLIMMPVVQLESQVVLLCCMTKECMRDVWAHRTQHLEKTEASVNANVLQMQDRTHSEFEQHAKRRHTTASWPATVSSEAAQKHAHSLQAHQELKEGVHRSEHSND